MSDNRKLVLADGTVFLGKSLGSDKELVCEVVFQTAKTGYQDVLTDPDNYNQIVVMTHLGSDYANNQDAGDILQGASALIVAEHCKFLDAFLKEKDIPALYGVNTEVLAEKIRKDGVMYGILSDADVPDEDALIRLTSTPYVTNHVRQVSPKKPYTVAVANKKFTIALIAFTAKKGIINEFTTRGCEVIVLPYNTSAEEIEVLQPDGIMLSSGPGDPVDLPELFPVIRTLQAKYPLFGICLGHQLFALANGASTSKMKYGHRGEAILVKDIATEKILATFQNHGYHVDADSLEDTNLEMTQYAIDDGSIEGLRHKKYPAFTVQYHPEVHSELQNFNYLFDQFLEAIEMAKTSHI